MASTSITLTQALACGEADASPCNYSQSAEFTRERAGASFNTRELTYLLDGGDSHTHACEKVSRELEADPVFRSLHASVYDLSRPDVRRLTVEHIRGIYRQFIADGTSVASRNARLEVCALFSPDWATRNGVHFGLFLGAVTSNGDEEQVNEWVPLGMSLSIFGCFAMTELRGGSYVKGLETRAVFVPGAAGGDGEFDLHTPNVGATKWWIGGAGETATHAAVYARCMTPTGPGGTLVDHGVHVFLVQLRDMDTHAPMPGVRVGDVGAKFGRNGIDNGWIQFHHVRLPRSAMLRKAARVEPDGTYIRDTRTKPQLAYAALVLGRATMVADSATTLKLATTIAVRWACARRQGVPFRDDAAASPASLAAEAMRTSGASRPAAAAATDDDDDDDAAPRVPLEPQLLDYATHQYKLMPLLATAVAFNFTAHRMKEMYENLVTGMNSDDLSLLPDVHATSAGLKAFCTWATHYGIDTCRQACGGHGYSKYSRLPSLFADFSVNCTWEGDNTVMALQTARYLISSLAKARAKAPLAGSVRYLVDKLPATCDARSADALLDPNVQLTAMRWRARTAVLACSAALDAARKKGASEGEAWNATSVPLVDASRAHVYLNIAAFFAVVVDRRRIIEEDVLPIPAYGAADTIDILSGRAVVDTDFVNVCGSAGAGFTRLRGDPSDAEEEVGARRIVPPPRRRRRARATSVGAKGSAAPPTAAAAASTKPNSTCTATAPLYPLLAVLRNLFVLHTITNDAAFYLRHGFLSSKQVAWAEAHVASLCARVRTDALAIVDAFNISDFVINSPMAVKSGDVYTAYMHHIKTRVPEAAHPGGVTPYYADVIRPMFDGQDLAMVTEAREKATGV